MSQPFDITLIARQQPSPGLLLLRFARADGQPFVHQAGQFIQLNLVDAQGQPQRRSYSLSTRSDHGLGAEVFECAVSLVPGGLASATLADLPPGGCLSASGPLGRFVLPAAEHNRRYLLLATGTGVSPYRGMLPQLAAAIGRGQQVVLLHGARTLAELPYVDEFMELAAAQPGFVYLPCLSRQWPVALPGAVQGHVQQHLAGLAPDPANDIAYLCGNPGMVDAGFAALRAAGFGMPRIRREKYLSQAG